MEVLERIWEVLGLVFGSLAGTFERSLTSLFGSSNARYIKKLQAKVNAINALEPKYQAMSDAELRQQTVEFRRRLAAGETVDDLLTEAFAVCREGGRRFIGLRHYDVQFIGGMVLHSGNIAEMVTGEGKTLVATLPAYLNALEGRGVHVVTVNDYLARRDMEWMGPLYMGLGLTVGAIYAGMENDEKQQAYSCDITYGTNNEFGFDYLRDNMKSAARGDDRYPKGQQQVQRPLHYAVVDEVDNILIDEARTPLIISGPAYDDLRRYGKADEIARRLKKDVHFEVKEKEHSVHLTDEGVREAERLAGVESFYTAGNMDWPHLIDNALKAHYLYRLDVNYVIDGGEIIIVDEFTGRKMPGRQWSDGLHQAVEAKEGVKIKEETQTYATITLQNYFKLYKKISGMTGTAMTEASEFWKIYKLDVIAIPTNRALTRVNNPDVIYRTEREKYTAIIEEDRAHSPLGHRHHDRRSELRRPDFQGRARARRNPNPGNQEAGAGSARKDQVRQPAWPADPGRHGLHRKERAAEFDAQQGGHQAPGAQRQVPPTRGRDHFPGRPQGSRDHRHQHGRPRHRHHPGRQSGNHGLGLAAGQVRHAPRRAAGRMAQARRRHRAARADEGRRPGSQDSWAACTSSAASATKPAASTCSYAAVADARAIPAAAGSSCRWKTI